MYWTRKKEGKNDRADSSFPMLKIFDYRTSVASHMNRPYHAIRIEENVILSMSTDWETLLFFIVFVFFSLLFFVSFSSLRGRCLQESVSVVSFCRVYSMRLSSMMM